VQGIPVKNCHGGFSRLPDHEEKRLSVAVVNIMLAETDIIKVTLIARIVETEFQWLSPGRIEEDRKEDGSHQKSGCFQRQNWFFSHGSSLHSSGQQN
jgi:hypothetical protein